ncbi:MAG: LamG domain-containing protein [Actinomycetota bacterium]
MGRATRRTGIIWLALTILALAASGSAVAARTNQVIIVVPGCAIDPADLVAWWTGEDTLSAEVGPDLSGSPSFGDGLIDRNFEFALGSPELAVSNFPELLDEVSVDAWVRPDDIGTIQTIAALGIPPYVGPGEFAYQLSVGPRGQLMWLIDPVGARQQEAVFATVDIHDGFYHHVAATYSRATGEMALYFDGSLVASAVVNAGSLNAVPGSPFVLGGLFSGGIDEVGVHSVALTPTQIDELRAAGPNGKCLTAEVMAGASGATAAATARFKGANSGNEVYLGPMTDPSALPRVEAPNQWTPATTFAFSVDYLSFRNELRSSVTGTPGTALDWDFDVDGAPGCPVAGWDVLDIAVRDSRTDGGIRLVGLELNDQAIGDLGSVDVAGTPGTTAIHVENVDLSFDWNLTGDIEIAGAFTGNEAMRVEATVGCRP